MEENWAFQTTFPVATAVPLGYTSPPMETPQAQVKKNGGFYKYPDIEKCHSQTVVVQLNLGERILT